MATPAVWMIPPTMKTQHASNMVLRRPKGSVYDARNAPQKQPAVKSATTVPERESPFFWRKLALNESEATTSAMTPLRKCQTEHNVARRCLLTDRIQKETTQWLQSSLLGTGKCLTSLLLRSWKRKGRQSSISIVHVSKYSSYIIPTLQI